MLTSERISPQQLINDYEFASRTASVHILQVFTYSLSYVPVLILSIMALKRLRQRHSLATSRSPKWPSRIILAQLIFITLRFTFSVVLNVFVSNEAHYSVLNDGTIYRKVVDPIYNGELGVECVTTFSARAVEVLASVVLVWRAWVIYPDVFWVRFILVLAWVMDLAVEALYFGAFITDVALDTSVLLSHIELSHIGLYASRWTSVALNILVTLSIGYRAWKFKNSLTEAGLTTKKSTVYKILSRLVETGVLLLAVQLLVAILATRYTPMDLPDPGYDAMVIIAELSLFVINAHPAAISLISADILLEEGRSSRNNESPSTSGCMVFRVAETRVSTEDLRSSMPSVGTEK